jgi:hypothetical protein
MSGDGEENLDELARELRNDEYPLPEEKDEKQVSYKNVDVTITFKKDTEKDAIIDEKKRVLFTDSGFVLDNLQFDETKNVLRIPIVLAKEMVYHYDDYDAFRPRDELEAIASFIKGVPVTRGHPEGKIVTDRSEVLGCAVDAEFEDDELRAVLEITNKDLIEDIRTRKLRGVSPGHFSRLDKAASGEYEGKHYDVTQRDIYVDHIAIVEEGRCNVADGCGIIMDESVKEGDDKERKKEEGEKRIMVSKGILDILGAAIKLAEKLEDEALKTKLEELEKALEAETEKGAEGDEKKGEKAKINDELLKTVRAERDELKVKLDEIVSEEKTKLVDELGTLQDVKTEEQLKVMSLDALKSDLELVKALRDTKVTFGDDRQAESGSGAIANAYKEVGRKGGTE